MLRCVFERGHATAELEKEVDAELDALCDTKGESLVNVGLVPYRQRQLATAKRIYNAPLQ